MHSGTKTIGMPAPRTAFVSARSSATAPRQKLSAPISRNVIRRIAVPPPQQKFCAWSPSIVAMDAFQTDPSALASALFFGARIGSSQRYVVAAPILGSPSGVISLMSQPRLGSVSASVKTITSNASSS